MKNSLRFITFHYVSLLVAMLFYFSKFPAAFSQNLNWVKQIQGTGSDFLKSMTSDASGNIYTVGAFTETIDFDPDAGVVNGGPAHDRDIWFGKYSATGSLIWAKWIEGCQDGFGWDIALDNAGNIYITGFFGAGPPPDFDPGPGVAFPTVAHGLFLAKYSDNGTFLWLKTIGATDVTTRAHAIAVDASSNVYIAGTLWATSTKSVDFGANSLSTVNGSVFFARFNSSGVNSWAKIVGPGNSTTTELWDMALDASNNIHITGKFSGVADFHPTATSPTINSANGSAYVCKYTSSGGHTWTKQVTGQNGDEGRRLGVDGSGNVYVTGGLNTSGGNIFLAKFNSSGTQQILKSIGGANSDIGHALTLDGAGSLYLTGFFNGANVDFGNFKLLTSSGSFHNFFYGKYSLSTLSCQWVRRVDFNLVAPDFEMNGMRLVNNKLVLGGNFIGSGDFTTCGDFTAFNAPTLDAFLIGYNTTDAPFGIIGPDEVCEAGPVTFTAVNVPLGATVTWTASPGTLVTPTSGTGNPFTITVLPGVSGTVSVSASVPAECGGTAFKSFTIGLPGGGSACAPSNLILEPCNTLYAETCSGGPLYNWYIDGNLVVTGSTYYQYISLILNPLGPGQHSLCVAYANSCGEGPRACTTFITPDCGGGQQFIMGYPNPTQSAINFVLEPGGKETVDYEYKYKLIDKNGAAVRGATTRKNALVIDVSDLKKDTYFFKVWLPNQRIEQRIVIN
jgi:hypothetical protein